MINPIATVLIWLGAIAAATICKTYFRLFAGWNMIALIALAFVGEVLCIVVFGLGKSLR